jgi:uncharacterized protein YndB with AHSA1/START domain
MTKPDFVYVSYIATTPHKVWQALTDPELMRQYWGDPAAGCSRMNISDWKVGSRWEHRRSDGSGIVDIVGTVLECEPPRRLVYSWARPADEGDRSKHSRVACDIEAYGDALVRLTVTHTELRDDTPMREGITGGWPKVLSNLKTLLETGHEATPSPFA